MPSFALLNQNKSIKFTQNSLHQPSGYTNSPCAQTDGYCAWMGILALGQVQVVPGWTKYS